MLTIVINKPEKIREVEKVAKHYETWNSDFSGCEINVTTGDALEIVGDLDNEGAKMNLFREISGILQN